MIVVVTLPVTVIAPANMYKHQKAIEILENRLNYFINYLASDQEDLVRLKKDMDAKLSSIRDSEELINYLTAAINDLKGAQ